MFCQPQGCFARTAAAAGEWPPAAKSGGAWLGRAGKVGGAPCAVCQSASTLLRRPAGAARTTGGLAWGCREGMKTHSGEVGSPWGEVRA